ncbi:PAS-domain containing protein [Pseudovibrio sp. SPO723]|uniref:PAS-domain containing protein n=1 Tax=Nesiotobacter zosterae TaxID=392721 RepID=UPI0029C51F65|nr:PAS-domain containing protein [Pseudovibrio sp. SPO723]MDX5595673.1 PAS-domain containing protein [Pseudovibrio sp. SPO723]
MNLTGIKARLTLIIAIASLAVLIASGTALWTIGDIQGEVSEITEKEFPRTASALTLALIGERLQRHGESLMTAAGSDDRDTIQNLIGADLSAMRSQLVLLRQLLPDLRGAEEQLVLLSSDLAFNLTSMRQNLETQTELELSVLYKRAQLMDQKEGILQVLGPSVLAINAIVTATDAQSAEVLTKAISSQDALLTSERLINSLMVQVLLAERATNAEEVRQRSLSYQRTLQQFLNSVGNLPKGLKDRVQRHLGVLESQTTDGSIFDIKTQLLSTVALLQATIDQTRGLATALDQEVDILLANDQRSIMETSGRISDLFVTHTVQFLISSLLIVLLLVVLAYSLIARPIVKNAMALTRAMTRIASGEPDVTIPGLQRKDEMGDIARALSVMKDTIARIHGLDKELAEQSQLLITTLDTMTDGFTVYDANAELVAWNPRFLSLYNLQSNMISAGTPIRQVHASLARQGIRVFELHGPETDYPTVARSRMLVPKQFELRAPSGRIIEMRSTPIPDGGHVTIHLDVTEQRSAEERVRQAQKMETVGELTSGLAHEFNNILAVIAGNLNIIERGLSDDPRLKERAHKAMGAVERATMQVERLVMFSRRQKLSPEDVEINELISGLVQLFQYSLGPDIEVETELEADLPMIRVDPVQLENALMSLAVNAKDAMEKGGTLTISTATGPDNSIEITVADTGIGISEEALQKVINPFFTTKPAGKGTGLGLSMVHGFVSQSGGSIDITSEQGKGTKVLMRFGASLEHVSQPGIDVRTPRGQGELVLVVDNDLGVLDVTAAQLEALGYNVDTAAAGEEALAKLKANPEFKLLYSEAMLPRPWDGEALAKEAKGLNPDLAILLTSAELGALDHVPHECLQKPVPERVLARAVHDQIRRKASQSSAHQT